MLSTAHFGLVVTNLERSLAFYQDVLGFELIGTMEREGEDISRIVGLPGARLKIAFLKLPGAGGVSMELIEYLSPRGQPIDTRPCNPGNAHISLLAEDVHAAYLSLKARGVKFQSEPVRIQSGLNRGGWAIYFQDPDGFSLELSQAPPRQN